jgi:hypothetical protein
MEKMVGFHLARIVVEEYMKREHTALVENV